MNELKVKVRMIILAKLFIRNFLKKSYQNDMRYHMTLNLILVDILFKVHVSEEDENKM